MNFDDYIKAKGAVTVTSASLGIVVEAQACERAELRKRLQALDMAILPFRSAAAVAQNVLEDRHRRLLSPVKIEHPERKWPSAVIHAHGCTEWFGRRAWLRMMGGHKKGPEWQWGADVDLFSPDGRLNRVFRGFGPYNGPGDFQQHLTAVVKMLEDSGYILRAGKYNDLGSYHERVNLHRA